MNDSGIKIEVHLIQNFAPSNLNRDDTGQPKSACFGGFRRARISSQCSKRSIRQIWPEQKGVRTKLLKAELMPLLMQDGRTEDVVDKAVNYFIKELYSKLEKKKGKGKDKDKEQESDSTAEAATIEAEESGNKTAVLLFVSPDEIVVSVSLINKFWDQLSKEKGLTKKELSECDAALKTAKSAADIALFGRMLAEQPGRNTDGACQVAHPISTHKVDMEMDFYTAVDDLASEEQTGAGMMGVIGFNSACYYRYAVVDRDLLARNLSGKVKKDNNTTPPALTAEDYVEADKVIRAFLNAMVYAIPSGKQNSFAAQNLPAFGLFVRREKGVSVSLANAFSKPVRPTHNDDDLVGLSVAALAKHWDELRKVYGDLGMKTTACFHLNQKERLQTLQDADQGSVEEAIGAVLGDA